MKISEKTRKNTLLLIIGVCAVATLVLGIDYAAGRKAVPEEISVDAPAETLRTEENRVLVSVSTDTIRDGLAAMGTLITQEYYFTQVEKYTREKTFLKVLSSSSEMLYCPSAIMESRSSSSQKGPQTDASSPCGLDATLPTMSSSGST